MLVRDLIYLLQTRGKPDDEVKISYTNSERETVYLEINDSFGAIDYDGRDLDNITCCIYAEEE